MLDREVEKEIAHLRGLLEAQINANDQRYAAVEQTHRDALRVALEALDKRLAGMNEFREALSDQANLMITRAESEAARRLIADRAESAIAALDAKLDAELKPLHAALEEVNRPNWPLIASMMSLFMVMVAGVWLVIGLKIDATLSPVTLVMEQVRTIQARDTERLRVLDEATSSSLQADVASKTDRAQLNERMRLAEQLIASNEATVRAETADQHAKLLEIETQFCGSDIIRNLMHATDLRNFSMIWKKLFNDVMPTDNAFYPQVCNRQSHQ